MLEYIGSQFIILRLFDPLRNEEAGCRWFTPVILATWENEMGESWFQDSQAKKFARPHLNGKKLDMVAHTSSYIRWEV
jgi:hypothetical protein